jgi:hypothetical protein
MRIDRPIPALAELADVPSDAPRNFRKYLAKAVRYVALGILLAPGSLVGIGSGAACLYNKAKAGGGRVQKVLIFKPLRIPNGASEDCKRVLGELQTTLPNLIRASTMGGMQQELMILGKRYVVQIGMNTMGKVGQVPLRVADERGDVLFEDLVELSEGDSAVSSNMVLP